MRGIVLNRMVLVERRLLMDIRALPLALVACMLIAGCGKPPMQSVTGTVLLNGKPVPDCKVGFFPDVEKFDTNRHGYGYGLTDAEGKFKIQHPQGEEGIWAGKYKVTLEAWVDKKGNPIPPMTKPSEVEGGVKNLLPDMYSYPSETPERVTVVRGANDFTIEVKS